MSKSRAQDEKDFLEALTYLSNIYINGHGLVRIHWQPKDNIFVADYGSLPMHDFRADEMYRKFLLLHQAVRTNRRQLSYNGSPIEAVSDGPSRLTISRDAVLKKYAEDFKAATAFLAEQGTQMLNEYKESKTKAPTFLEKGKIEGAQDLFNCINSKEFLRFYAKYLQVAEEKNKPGRRL